MPRPKGCNSAASCSACAGESLTPSSSASSTTSPRSLAGLVASDARKASRSSPIEWRVVGTSVLRSASSAACTDQASRQGSASAARRMCAGDGPTVETHTQRAERANAFGCTSSSTARRTSSKLLSGSPIPIKTTLTSGGKRRCRIVRSASQTCARISSARKLRSRPIVPVEQKVQPREQPTCDEMQSDVVLPPTIGIRTHSTASPSSSLSSSFCVPSEAMELSLTAPAHTGPQSASRRRRKLGEYRFGLHSVSSPSDLGSTPLRSSDHTPSPLSDAAWLSFRQPNAARSTSGGLTSS
mmetsp:Transcript_34287/g.110334  ORF Transcript_34287/g.110334 Transcript_34287/m.110334 type:complete len:298 (+) Transcript_34287:1678-2571(+)